MRLIDADALKENAREWIPEIVAHKSPFVVMGLFDLIDNLADNMPTIDPVKHGKWEREVRTIRGCWIPFFSCSVCGENADDEYHYCPNCGADMRGE